MYQPETSYMASFLLRPQFRRLGYAVSTLKYVETAHLLNLLMKITLVDENSTEKFCPISRVLPSILTETEYIYIDISANSAPILVAYNYLHIPCPHGCFM